MKDKVSDQAQAITLALPEREIVIGSCYGNVSWREWCRREMKRMNAGKGGGNVRIARDGERIWLTRV